MEFYEAIGKFFHTSKSRIARDNMPVLVRRGTRGNLTHMFAAMGLNIGAEIGTRYGAYAVELCKANPNLHLYCVDPWIAYHNISQQRQNIIHKSALENLADYNVTIIRKQSMEALADFGNETLDFVFIDGNHMFDYACADIIFWSWKVRKGGIVAVHDYMAGHGAGVMKAVDAYTHCHNIRPWFVTRESVPTVFWVKK